MASVNTVAVVLASSPVTSRLSNRQVRRPRSHLCSIMIRDLHNELEGEVHGGRRRGVRQIIRGISPSDDREGKKRNTIRQIATSLPLLRRLRTGHYPSP